MPDDDLNKKPAQPEKQPEPTQKPDSDAKDSDSKSGEPDGQSSDSKSGQSGSQGPDDAENQDPKQKPPEDDMAKTKGGKDVASEKDDKKSKHKGNNKIKEILKKIQQAAHMAAMALKALSFAQFIMMMKMMLGMLAQLITAAAAAVASLVMSVVTMVATAIGVTVAVAVGGIVGIIALAVVVVVVAVGSTMEANNVATKDDMPPCNTDITYMEAPDDIPIQAWLNAKLIYSFYKSYSKAGGAEYSDAQIAGILGNWYHESGLDPTAVETVFDEQFAIGPTKLFLWQGKVSMTWTWHTEWDEDGSYTVYDYTTIDPDGADGLSVAHISDYSGTRDGATLGITSSNKTGSHEPLGFEVKWFKDLYQTSYWATYPAIEHVGIGLGQWTNGRTTGLLEYAEKHGRQWYDLSAQLMYSINADTAGAGVFANWLDSYEDSVDGAAEAAEYFAVNWEGMPAGHESLSIRTENAALWYDIISDWKEGVDYTLTAGSSLWSAVEGMADRADDLSKSSAIRDCAGVKFADNSSLAAAIVSYAWGPGKPYNNNGTQCWQHLFTSMAPGDPYFKSCDRTVAIAVWWTGTDSAFPLGSTRNQLQYLIGKGAQYETMKTVGGSMGSGSAYWERVETEYTGDMGAYVAQLQPGDVLIRNDNIEVPDGRTNSNVGHVVMYVGPETVQRRWPDADPKYCVVSGSINTNSPHVQSFTFGNIESAMLQYYTVFRNRMAYCSEDGRSRTALTCAAYSNEK